MLLRKPGLEEAVGKTAAAVYDIYIVLAFVPSTDILLYPDRTPLTYQL